MTKKAHSYRDLVAWKKAVELVTEIYYLTKNFPKEEMFGLVSQIRRAAGSIPSNIAEGHARASRKEFQYFLSNSRGSVAELETHLIISHNLGFIIAPDLNRLLVQVAEVGRIINGLLTALKNKAAEP
ncbi:MAG: four helix bundle protein [Deltaproteobacteria bacterium]|nr:four helix bundle protein [Deltaproteobacteria bacterium]